MITLIDVKKAIITLLKTKYPNHNYYSIDKIESLERPAIITSVRPLEATHINYNTNKNLINVDILLFQDIISEEDCLIFIEAIRELFGLDFQCNDRRIKCTDYDYDFEGKNDNVLQVTITMEYYNKIREPETKPLITNVECNFSNEN